MSTTWLCFVALDLNDRLRHRNYVSLYICDAFRPKIGQRRRPTSGKIVGGGGGFKLENLPLEYRLGYSAKSRSMFKYDFVTRAMFEG